MHFYKQLTFCTAILFPLIAAAPQNYRRHAKIVDRIPQPEPTTTPADNNDNIGPLAEPFSVPTEWIGASTFVLPSQAPTAGGLVTPATSSIPDAQTSDSASPSRDSASILPPQVSLISQTSDSLPPLLPPASTFSLGPVPTVTPDSVAPLISPASTFSLGAIPTETLGSLVLTNSSTSEAIATPSTSTESVQSVGIPVSGVTSTSVFDSLTIAPSGIASPIDISPPTATFSGVDFLTAPFPDTDLPVATPSEVQLTDSELSLPWTNLVSHPESTLRTASLSDFDSLPTGAPIFASPSSDGAQLSVDGVNDQTPSASLDSTQSTQSLPSDMENLIGDSDAQPAFPTVNPSPAQEPTLISEPTLGVEPVGIDVSEPTTAPVQDSQAAASLPPSSSNQEAGEPASPPADGLDQTMSQDSAAAAPDMESAASNPESAPATPPQKRSFPMDIPPLIKGHLFNQTNHSNDTGPLCGLSLFNATTLNSTGPMIAGSNVHHHHNETCGNRPESEPAAPIKPFGQPLSNIKGGIPGGINAGQGEGGELSEEFQSAIGHLDHKAGLVWRKGHGGHGGHKS